MSGVKETKVVLGKRDGGRVVLVGHNWYVKQDFVLYEEERITNSLHSI